jgi:hypothetical protein
LEKLLGNPLPPEARPWKDYRGPARLVVLTSRPEARRGESLKLKVLALAPERFKTVSLHWRPLGRGEFKQCEVRHLGRAVYEAALPPAEGIGLEYYVQGTTNQGRALVWPAAAPQLNQTVVVTDR